MVRSKQKDGRGNALPFWHYRGMKGEPAWFSKDHKAVALKRFYRICRANNVGGKAMRYCTNCEVGIGIMTQSAYIHACAYPCTHICRVCKKPIYDIPPDK